MLSHAHRLLALSREARQAMDGFLGKMSGELLIGASTIPGEYILPPLIGGFKAKFPDISITLLIGDSQAAVDWVGDGRAELSVVGARLPHRGVDYHELMADDIVVVVPAAHPWHGRAEITVEELRSEPLLIRERGSGTRAALERALADAAREAGIDLFRAGRYVDICPYCLDLAVADHDSSIVDVGAANRYDMRIANRVSAARKGHALLRCGIADLLGNRTRCQRQEHYNKEAAEDCVILFQCH